MMRLLLPLFCASLAGTPGPSVALTPNAGLFTVHGEGDAATVSANQNGVAADMALKKLARVMGWGYRPATSLVVQELGKVSLDLSFRDQKPRIIAQLVAVTAGMDVTFDDRTSAVGYTAIMPRTPVF